MNYVIQGEKTPLEIVTFSHGRVIPISCSELRKDMETGERDHFCLPALLYSARMHF